MRKQFGDMLRELRIEKNMTQEELAKIFNTGKASISHYESNRRFPDISNIESFADFFGVSVDYMLGRTNNRTETIESEGKLSNDNIRYKKYDEIFEELKRRLINEGIIKENEPISEELMKKIIKYGQEAAIEISKMREQKNKDNITQ